MVEAAKPAAAKPATAPAKPAAAKPAKPPEPIIEFVDVPAGRALVVAALVVGLGVGVLVYYLLTHVMIEDADNA